MPRVANPRPVVFAALAAGAALAAPRPAAASYPCSTYVVPSLVELLPSDDAATRVVIHGAFFQLTSDTAMIYGDPRCGVMYFACVSGQEDMCRMQWKELRDAISPTSPVCQGFGSWNVISTAAVRSEGAPLGAPDAWDLGMGITQGSYVDNKCPPALRLACPISSGDGGVAVDAAPQPDAAPGDDAAPEPDAAPADDGGPGDAAPSGDARPPQEDAAPPPADARPDRAAADGGADADGRKLVSRGGGCAIATSERAPVPAAPMVVAVVLLAARRRRRARR